jgi:Asp-tRNA(Asn)/Glu-tRNA(Gln) amidotransferase A subunit family amidase
MTKHHAHVSDDRLVDLCLEEAPLQAELQHLAGCAMCQGRRSRLADLLIEARHVVEAQADAYFTVDRLAKQRAHILERLDHEARHGRVITFPTAYATAVALRARPGMRWLAGAAAAGLLIGFVADHVAHRVPARQASSTIAAIDAGPATLQLVAAPLSDEELLGRMELAVEGMTGSALQPLDDLTPRVWEVAAQ